MKHVVQYPGPYGSLLNFYCNAESIEDAERIASLWGIEGEGFEVIEQRAISEQEAQAFMRAKGLRPKLKPGSNNG